MQQSWDLGGFEPFNESHAIVMASLSVQFGGMLDESAWPAVRKRITEAGRNLKLGPAQPFYGLNLSFDQARVNVNMNAPSPAIGETAGLSFTTVNEDDQLVERFVAAKDSIVVQTGAYVRWNSFISRAREFISALWDGYAEHMPAMFIKCEYWDRFEHRGEAAPVIAKIIRLDGELIAPAAVQDATAWHSHTGFYTTAASGASRLTNVRVDCADFRNRDGQMSRSILIYTMLQDGGATADGHGNAFDLEGVLATLEEQHLELKENLNRIITEDASSRIKLQGF